MKRNKKTKLKGEVTEVKEWNDAKILQRAILLTLSITLKNCIEVETEAIKSEKGNIEWYYWSLDGF